MNSKVKEEVAKKFENQEKISNFLQIHNYLEDVKYRYNNHRPEKADAVSQYDLEKYWFKNYKNKLPSDCENMNFQDFETEMKNTLKGRYRAGVIAETDNKQLPAIKIKDDDGNVKFF